MSEAEGQRVRVRTAGNDRRKALAHYHELRRSGRSKRAVVISESEEGEVTVLGQMLGQDGIARLLLVAANAMSQIAGEQLKPRREPHQEPAGVGEPSRGGALPQRGITLDAEGIMVPPAGETIISCGQCRHPRWYVLFTTADERPSRYACAHCGNEVVVRRIDHAEGRA